jgi:hypothetical protein
MNNFNLTVSKCFAAVMIIIAFASCDKVNKPYKVTENVLMCDVIPDFPALDNVVQKYLLEDYTGHTCTNCPSAHNIIANNLKPMDDTLVVIAIHSGDYARPEDGVFSADFRTEAGNEYAKEFKISSYPSGMINRMLFNNDRIVSYSKWKNTLAAIPRKPADIGIQIITELNNDIACIFVKTSLLDNISGKLRLCALLTEDNIISPQKNGSRVDTNYVHNHVLRTSLAPVWGNNMEISAKDESFIKGYSVDFNNTAWKREDCHIVAFVYNADTYEILQVEEIKLVP